MFGFPNTTVVYWLSGGASISGEACTKLLGLGCDLKWLLTGVKEQTPPALSAGGVEISERLLRLIKVSSNLQFLLQQCELDAMQSFIAEDDLEILFNNIVPAIKETRKKAQQAKAKKKPG